MPNPFAFFPFRSIQCSQSFHSNFNAARKVAINYSGRRLASAWRRQAGAVASATYKLCLIYCISFVARLSVAVLMLSVPHAEEFA